MVVRLGSKGFEGVFFRVKPARMLILLNSNNTKKYASIIAKGVDCTYSHTIRILQQFRKKGLIQFNKKGRLKEISLTDSGRKLADLLEKSMAVIDKL